MAYIGNTLQNQNYVPAIDYFSGDGATVAFTASRPIASVAQVQAVISNVPQNPGSAFTVSGNTITFTSAPPSGTNNIYVYYTSPNTSVATISQAPVIIGPEYVAINNATPLSGATNPIVAMSGSANNYVQSYIQNTTNAVNSSADFTAYPSNGADSSGWVDVGITGPTFAQALYSVTGPNESYLFGSAPSGSSTTGNLVYATDSTGTQNYHQWYTGGFTKAKNAWGMQLDSSGNLTNTGTFTSGSRGIAKASMPSGAVLQVVSTTLATPFTTTSTSYTNVTGLSVSITPTSATSKIMVMGHIVGNGTAGVTQLYAQLTRNGTPVGGGTASGSRPSCICRVYMADGGVDETAAYFYLDSPATTSAATYQIQVQTEGGGTAYVNQTPNDSNSANGARGSSSITVMEIAA